MPSSIIVIKFYQTSGTSGIKISSKGRAKSPTAAQWQTATTARTNFPAFWARDDGKVLEFCTVLLIMKFCAKQTNNPPPQNHWWILELIIWWLGFSGFVTYFWSLSLWYSGCFFFPSLCLLQGQGAVWGVGICLTYSVVGAFIFLWLKSVIKT